MTKSDMITTQTELEGFFAKHPTAQLSPRDVVTRGGRRGRVIVKRWAVNVPGDWTGGFIEREVAPEVALHKRFEKWRREVRI